HVRRQTFSAIRLTLDRRLNAAINGWRGACGRLSQKPFNAAWLLLNLGVFRFLDLLLGRNRRQDFFFLPEGRQFLVVQWLLLDLVVFDFLDLVIGHGGPQDFFFLPEGRQFLVVQWRLLDLVVFDFLDLIVGHGSPQDFFFLSPLHLLLFGRRLLDLVVFR